MTEAGGETGSNLGAHGLVVRDLHKQFRLKKRGLQIFMPWRPRSTIEALRGVSLEVRAGELVALLGPNGAGKTTLLKILAALVSPDAGAIFIDGIDATHRPEWLRSQVGYVLTEERSFYWRLTVQDNLRFFAALEGLHGRAATRRIETLAVYLALDTLLTREFSDLSSGQKQRVAIARGLLSDPPIVLFDEATRSLDPGRAAQVQRVVRKVLVEDGQKAVIFATHELDEARALADRAIAMRHGTIFAEGPYQDIAGEVDRLFREEAETEDREVFRLLEEERPRP